MARARPARWIVAIATAAAVHAGLLIGVSWMHPPIESETREPPVAPLLIDLEPRRPDQPKPHHAAANPLAPKSIARATSSPATPSPEGVAPAIPSAPGSPTSPPGGSGGSGTAPVAEGGLKTGDCPPGFRPSRPGEVRADPCAYRGQSRDHLPAEVVKQASIDADKAAYYDRVVAAHHAPGSLPGLACAPGLTKKNKPQNTLKLGPLPCIIVPPLGPLTSEAMVPPIPPKNPVRSDEFGSDP